MPATTDPPENQGDGRTRSRLESEIEEILERAEREHPTPPPLSLDDARKERQRRERSRQLREQVVAVVDVTAVAVAAMAVATTMADVTADIVIN